ncbi:helix-turn-helix domain-containing protein [Nostoc sp.]|uniref:helix-turn-helix domain-containing protein n=1 Tax=Nostoc sp. TaxID=1180 RepID=UPI002FF93DD5
MKQLAKTLYSQLLHLFHQVMGISISRNRNPNPKDTNVALDKESLEDPSTQLSKQIPLKDRVNKSEQNLLLNYQYSSKPQRFKKASLFPDSKTNIAALSLVLYGVAEVLSQKMNLSWKSQVNNTFNYEKEAETGKGKIFYYVTDNPETPQPETLAEEAALVVIDEFDPRACAIHLIYCALVASLDKPWSGHFVIDDKQLLEYTGLVKRRDLCKHEKLSILYSLLRQPAQVLACIAWPKQEKAGTFTVADLKIWDISIIRDFKTDKAGNNKLVALKVIGQAGVWTKYFLNKSKYHYHTGIITKKTVQKLFSIGKQNAGAARMLVWLTFQIQSEFQDCVMGKTLMEIAYSADKVLTAEQDRQLRRQMADDFETDLKVVKEAGWQAELETGPAWLISSDRIKRPIGYWSEILNSKWRFHLPAEVQERLTLNSNQLSVNKLQPLSGNLIREARKAKGWSRAFFAITMGKSISWVDAVETGTRQVSQKDLPKLLNTLELHLNKY